MVPAPRIDDETDPPQGHRCSTWVDQTRVPALSSRCARCRVRTRTRYAELSLSPLRPNIMLQVFRDVESYLRVGTAVITDPLTVKGVINSPVIIFRRRNQFPLLFGQRRVSCFIAKSTLVIDAYIFCKFGEYDALEQLEAEKQLFSGGFA